MLDPIIVKLFFFTYFFIKIDVSLLHLVIFPFINFPDDFPWPEYSSAKKLNLFFLENSKKLFGFFPYKSDMKPCKKTINGVFLYVLQIYLIFLVFEI